MDQIIKREFTLYEKGEWVVSGDHAYVIDSEGDVSFDYCSSYEVENLNAFSTYEKAKEVADIQLLLRKIMKFRDENDKNIIDFLSKQEECWMPEIRVNEDHSIEIISEVYSCYRNMLGIGFSSCELCERCINEIIIPYYKDKGYEIYE